MNLFSDYQKKIFNSLQKLEKRKLIKIPKKIKSLNVELPPKEQKERVVADFIAGMTDRYATNIYEKIK